MGNALPVLRRLAQALALTAALASPGLAAAQTMMGVNPWPKLGLETVFLVQNDHLKHQGERPGDALNLQLDHQTLIEFDEHWSLSNQLEIAPQDGIKPGTTKVLSHHGLTVQELWGQWNNQVVRVKAGKFAQNFARAWYLTPGLYGQNFVGDYAIDGTLGVEGQVVVLPQETYGLHQLTVAAFMDDRTVLSESLFNNPGRLRYEDGGPGNTHGFKSYLVTYDATNVPVGYLGHLNYQLSYASLGRGFDPALGANGPLHDEHRYAASADINIPLNDIAATLHGRFNELRVIGEAVRIKNADGLPNQTRDYVTVAGEYVHGPWVFDLTGTDRWGRDTLGPTQHDHLRSFSIGYALPSDTTVSFGVARQVENGQSGVYVGLQLSQVLTVCDRCLIRSRHY